MARYSTSDLSQKSGDIIAEALRRPVSIEEYRRLTVRGNTRKVQTLDGMSDEDFAGFRRAVETYAAEGEER